MKKIIALLMSLSLTCLSGCEKEVEEQIKEVKAEEWIISLDETDEKLNELIKSTEDIYTLYVMGKMSSDDFLIELEVDQDMLFYVQQNYTEQKSKVTIDPKSDSDAKKGLAAFEMLFDDINGLYTASVDQTGSPYSAVEVSYIYLNYKDKIIDDYAVYNAAVILTNDDNLKEVEADNSAE